MKLFQLLIGCSISIFLCSGCHYANEPGIDDLFNESASRTNGQIGTSLPLDWHMITMLADRKSHETAVLYGNDIAFKYAKSLPKGGYPLESELALVTWLEKPDVHWYGASIAGKIRSIEKIRMEKDGNGQIAPAYSKYIGQELVSSKNMDSLKVAKSINFMLQLRRPYLPD